MCSFKQRAENPKKNSKKLHGKVMLDKRGKNQLAFSPSSRRRSQRQERGRTYYYVCSQKYTKGKLQVTGQCFFFVKLIFSPATIFMCPFTTISFNVQINTTLFSGYGV